MQVVMLKHIILRDLNSSFWQPKGFGFDPVAKDYSASSERNLPEPRVEVKALDEKDIRDAREDPSVAGIAPVMPTALIEPMETADAISPGAVSWGITAVKADHSPYTGQDVVVCVLDTGIDLGHAAFQGINFVHEDFSGDGIADVKGHGTHCAGTIFGRDVAGTRIGVARGVSKALIGKVLRNNGGGDSEMIFRGIQWALDQRADVVSMSLGFDFPGNVKALQAQGWPVDLATSNALVSYRANLRMFDALMGMVRARAAFDQGTVLVAASGNESHRELGKDYRIAVSVPGAAEGIISVGAIKSDYSIAPFSNSMPTLCAPGVQITSAKIGAGLTQMSGTSMACPHVAGVAALWWEAMRTASPDRRSTAKQIAARLLATAETKVFGPDVDIADRGAGLVSAPGGI